MDDASQPVRHWRTIATEITHESNAQRVHDLYEELGRAMKEQIGERKPTDQK